MKWFGVALGAGFVAAVLAAALGTTVAQAAPSESFSRPISLAERLLIAHNRERDRVGVPRLEWSPTLAEEAQGWAENLARTNRFEHSSDRGDVGENLWMGSAERYAPEQMIHGFVREVRHFRPGQFPHVSMTGSWHDVGHYTQLVWRDTRQVGCAVARGRANEVLVCRYWPAGNVIGRPVL